MKDFEILRVQMDTEDADVSAEYLEELFKKLKERFVKTGQNFLSALGNIRTTTTGLMASAKKAYQELSKGMETVGKGSLKRAVAGFDQLSRLAKNTGSGVVKQDKTALQSLENLWERAKQVGAKLQTHLLDPLKQIPQLGLHGGLANLGDHLRILFNITQSGTQQLQTMSQTWEKLGLQTDFWKDTVEKTNLATATFNGLMTGTGLRADETAQMLEKLRQSLMSQHISWEGLGSVSQSAWQSVSGVWASAAQWFRTGVTEPLSSSFAGFFDRITQGAERAKQALTGTFTQVGDQVGSTLARAWEQISHAFAQGGQVQTTVQSGVLEGFKKMGNSLIQGLNRVAAEPFAGLNTTLSKLQSIKIGSLQPFSFLTWRATVPQIPYLAQGAVLPANKPFLAMVGDQRHGTNVEAPLSTIQEAVSLAMEDYMQGNMAGHGATVEALQQILQAVLGIRVGDAVIAAACDRHHQKMAMVEGI